MSQIGLILDEVYGVVLDSQANPKSGSYTNYLLDKGIDKICKKIGEEAAEVIIAAKNGKEDEVTYETADILYNLCDLLVSQGVSLDLIAAEMRKRR